MKEKDIHIRVTNKMFNQVTDCAKKDRRKKTEVVTIALEEYLSKKTRR